MPLGGGEDEVGAMLGDELRLLIPTFAFPPNLTFSLMEKELSDRTSHGHSIFLLAR